jgi:hypothetical protein
MFTPFGLIILKTVILREESILSLKCMFHSSILILFKTFFAPINISKISSRHTHAGLRIKCPLLFSNFNSLPKGCVLMNFSRTSSSKFHEKPLNEWQIITHRHTNMAKLTGVLTQFFTVNLLKLLLGNHTVMSMDNYSSSRLISIMSKPSVLFQKRHS